eukprot:CAMPEP_0173410934 /NCGR_PEP_ID=MMETSP1356-20130122/75751_1 /TAXON_ID=77927 ORGANISM="Hemiselmis virescens, Strain PCC157" /NCGR_SAMPLE_ID=MMETSP1356 /ASSEMBLY_ACC=CAM_ASM_000847 /LENGTH=353 /DNA_ID=CAMNT_0014372613 /DNA_START=57 /DNA_END=1118 /DNA_ORIENTATION=+
MSIARSVGLAVIRTAKIHAPTGARAASTFSVDLTGKTAFVAGVADSRGYGWAIAKNLAEAGCKVLVGTWPVVLGPFVKQLESAEGFGVDQIMGNGQKFTIDKVYPLDLGFTNESEVTPKVLQSKYYAGLSGFDIRSVANKVKAEHGNIDFLVHSVANGPEVSKPLLQVSRQGYLAASSASAYSLIGLVQEFGPLMNKGGGVISISYVASTQVIPGYGGGMSSAKAQLESDTRTLAFEVGREYGVRVNTISAGPLKSRAASAIGKGVDGAKGYIDLSIDYMKANAPLSQDLEADDVGKTALALLSPMGRCITGETIFVDNGMHAMGVAVDSASFAPYPLYQNIQKKQREKAEEK